MSLSPADRLDQLLDQPRDTAFITPDRTEYQQAVTLFAQSLSNPAAGDLPQAWSALGFAMEEAVAGQIWAVRDTRKRGGGLYLFRKQGHLCMQIPHRFFDRHTGVIGLELFRAGPFRAAAWNTSSRKVHAHGTTTKADLARFPGAFFQAFHEAWLNRDAGRIIQIHGYARGKRKSAAGRKAHIILSSGAQFPLAFVRDGAQALQKAGFDGVMVFGDGVFELGGTTNLQAQSALKRGRPFLHIELSSETRKILTTDPARRQKFLEALSTP
ncbi:hypothetical protein [Acanthopleuribacter pedis]|uniref:Uncharacterized protein n=1 Tax=Acanthopleuribacter pedis TaxID=442870 RepID=A0A8J7QBK4_9BACT|nr:hypothetical protein [Acanthopleuribacter pedis]MBO1321099.1 hypothetical protein [Acanthopleuribacter pedis]